MGDRLSELEERMVALTESLQHVERRLATLERAPPARTAAKRAAPAAPAGSPVAQLQAELGATTAFVGRTLLVLAGAFLLRALTDKGTLPQWLGVGAGLVYAGTWIALADRASAAGKRASAGFHGVSAVVIGFPLLFEATWRFRLISPVLAAALLVAFTGVALGVAVRRDFQALALVVALGGTATAVALMPFTGRLAPPLVYLVLLGVAALWLGYVKDWTPLRWPVAIVTNLAVAVLAVRAVRPGAAEGPRTVLFVEVLLITLYLGSIALRTLLLDRRVVLFEVLQTAALLAVGLGGASFVAARTGAGAAGLGAVSAAIGIAAYAVAFAFVEKHQQHRSNFYFYTSVGLVFVLAGPALALPASTLALAWAVLGVAVGALARRLARRTLATHAAIYAVAAIFASGLLARAVEAAVSSPGVPWGRATAASVVVFALAAGAAWLSGGNERGHRDRIPRCALVAAVAASAAGLAIGALVPLVAGSPPAADAGAVATVRTAVLVVGVFVLASFGRSDRWIEARWLVYPVLVATGLKLVIEDVARSRPATLFLAFALYGAALILVPRLRRRATDPAVAPGA